MSVEVREVDTPVGPARVHLTRPAGQARGSLVLGHGAGGGVAAPDLVALTQLADEGWLVARVEQPWRVAGRRIATPPAQLDTAWHAVLAALGANGDLARPLVLGGRSAGARVACRTAQALDADAVLALAFPLHPPGRPERSRAHEALEVSGAGRPLLVIQGEKDPFGSPPEVRQALGEGGEVVGVAGPHAFAKGVPGVLEAATRWLARLAG